MVPSICPVLIKRVDNSHIRVHVVSNMMLILLSLIFKLPRNFFPENGHVLLNPLLNLLLDQESDSLPHVVRNFLKLMIILAIENVSPELAV